MRVIVLGASGMLGHKVWQHCSTLCETWATGRSAAGVPAGLGDGSRLIAGLDADQIDGFAAAITTVRPDAVVNCIGIVKQSPLAGDPVPCLTVNAVFPHRLARLCRAASTRLIHISTDCVFSGRTGGYAESDPPDAADLYGRSKLMGEPVEPSALTLRTSMIGREISTSHGLLEWFLGHRRPQAASGGQAATRGKRASEPTVRGFGGAVFSGLTTIQIARVVGDVLASHPHLAGIYHVSADPIDKHDLLCRLKVVYEMDVCIARVDAPSINRSLDSSRFRALTGWSPPSWDAMLEELAADPTRYDQWRQGEHRG